MRYVPSLACANYLALGQEIESLRKCGMNLIHYDIMDGHYVPNLCLNWDIADAIRMNYADVMLDVHLMTKEPEKYIEKLKNLNVKYVTFHRDATSFSYRLIEMIHAAGMKAGVALNLDDRPENMDPLLPYLDLVLVMSVEPGFAGQKFIPLALDNVRYMDRKRKEQGLHYTISVDGGVSYERAVQLRKAGADWIIMGMPTVFHQPDGIEKSYKRFADYMEKN